MYSKAYAWLPFSVMAAATSGVLAASFDCSKATSQVERLICDTPTLSQQDDALAASYRATLAVDPSARDRQKVWLREVRNQCKDVLCLATAYQQQIAAMSGAAAGSGGAPSAAAPAAARLGLPSWSCPIDWSALADIDGPDPERVVLQIKARDWHKEQLDALLKREQECQRENSNPESLREATLNDVRTRAYPNAIASIERRDRRSQVDAAPLGSGGGSFVPQQQAAGTVSSNSTPTSQRANANTTVDAAVASIQPAAAGRLDGYKTKLEIAGLLFAAALAAWLWNRFLRNRCPQCRSTQYDTTSVEEVDRWRGTRAVTKTVHRPGGIRGASFKDVTKHIATTYVKKKYSYRCRECHTAWAVERKEELR